MKIHNIIISIKANKGFFNPKNIIGHKKLRINCNPNIETAILEFLVLIFLFQIIYNESPIRKYKIIHTGPNNQLGGLKNGLFKFEYQVDIDDTVKIDPINPAN